MKPIPAKIDELQAAGHQPSYIYRGHKADIYEGGHRVPFIVRWPGTVKAESVSHQLIGQIDFMATFAEMLGTPLPPTAGEDSVSFLAALLGIESASFRNSIVSQSIDGNFAVRDGKWKLCLCPGSGGWSSPRPGRDDQSSLPEFQLFDLETDPAETNNLVNQHPDRVANMIAMLKQVIIRGRTTAGLDQPNDAEIVMVKPTPTPIPPKKAPKKSPNK